MWFNLAASGASDASDRDWGVKYRDLAAGLAKAIGATAFSRRLRCPKVRSFKTSASMSFSQFRSARDRRLAAIPRHPSLFPWTTQIRRWSFGNEASTGIEKDQMVQPACSPRNWAVTAICAEQTAGVDVKRS
jgi:hypothetical protein